MMTRYLLLLVAALAWAQQPDARALLDGAAHALARYPAYEVHSFSVVETAGALNNRMEMTTSIAVKRPDLLRIESQNGPLGVTVVSDGLATYIYFDRENKYIKRASTSLPESALGETGILRDLPDMNSALESVKVTGEKTMEIEDKEYDCWVVEAHYGELKVPSQHMTIRDAVEISWISKKLGITLQSSVTAKLIAGTVPEPVAITQATTTMGMSFNPDPASVFTFTPPPGAVETPDWTLPGIVKPDVEGKPAPPIKGAPPIIGKVALVDFCTTWSKPCKQQAPLLDKLGKEFAAHGLVVFHAPVSQGDPALKALSVNAYPTMILIDRQGNVALYEAGAMSESRLRAALAKAGIGAAKPR
jgi:thiol-disulfide isomerase/thioredoxin/outer membrane lipoprotein-sorting protein